ncbi:SinR family protein [Arthrobacter sp. BB-1]|uniref:SinR family protein n=1 Tax=unclassified Arthrobacter TaxID=235627 RepID=UPI0011125CEA|nr:MULTISPECIES: SinR family protein [unclassified Arthrobacter]TNB71599.1 SinR family protein [Arthrobacter sp. BB-1]
MKSIMVGYDLNKTGQNYDALIKRLKEYPTWWHHLDSTWLIRTECTAVQVRDELGKLLDGNDKLVVIEVTSNAAAWRGINQSGTDWIKEHL